MAKFNKLEFFKIERTTLKVNTILPFAIYLYLPLNKHIIKLTHENIEYTEALDKNFKKKNLNEFYCHIKDKNLYEEYVRTKIEYEENQNENDNSNTENNKTKNNNTNNLNTHESKTYDEPTLPPLFHNQSQNPNQLLDTPTEEEAQKLLSIILNNENNVEAKSQAIQTVKKLVQELDEPEKKLADILDSKNLGHSSNTCLITVLLGIGLGIKDKTILSDIAIAAFCHDLGLIGMNLDLLLTPTERLTNAQKNEYENHVQNKDIIFKTMQFTPSERVTKFIDQHHEKFDGSGYPNHVKNFSFDDYAQVLMFADFIDENSRGLHDGQTKNLKDAIEIIMNTEKNSNFPHALRPELFRKLTKWLKDEKILNEIETASTHQEEIKELLNQAQNQTQAA